jgi:hypothetical protein
VCGSEPGRGHRGIAFATPMLRQLAPEGATASGDPFISVEEANEHRAHCSACHDDAASALQLGAACVVPPDEDMGGGLTVVVGRSQSKIRLALEAVCEPLRSESVEPSVRCASR